MRRLLMVSVVVGAVLAGCAGGATGVAGSASSTVPGSGAPESRAATTVADLAGRYLVTSLTGFAEVPGSHLAIVISADRLAVDGSGCSPMSGPVEVRDGRLEVALDPVPPLGICDIDPAHLDQDAWLFAFLAADPELVMDGDRMVLTVEGTGVIELQRVSSGPVAALMIEQWRLVGIVRDGVLTAVPSAVTLRVTVNGMFRVRTACALMSDTVAVTDTTLTTSGFGLSTKPCDPALPGAEQVEEVQRVLAATFAGTAGYQVDDGVATVTGADGVQLEFVRG